MNGKGELENILKEIDRLGNHAIFHLKTGAQPHFLERILKMIISEAGKGIEIVKKARNGNNPKSEISDEKWDS